MLVFLAQLARTFGGTQVARHRLTGPAARAHIFTAVLAALELLIPLLQLNARLGEAAVGAWGASLAPYEWMGFGLSIGRWLALLALLLRELQGSGHVVLPGRWAVRFALVLGASAELVKARFLLLEGEQGAGGGEHPAQEALFGYFFYLYVTYLVIQLVLAALALTWQPGKRLGLVRAEATEAYLPLASSSDEEGAAAPGLGRSVDCPETTAGILSYLTFGWMSPLIRKGYLTPLTADDIWLLPPNDRVERIAPLFDDIWREELASKGPQAANLDGVCWRLTQGLFLWALPYKLVNDASQFVGPLFLNMMLRALADGSSAWVGYTAAALMFVGSAVGVLADNQHFQRVMRAGFRLKAVLAGAVHRQIFAMAPAARATFTSGRVYSLASSDVEAVQTLCQNVMGLVSSPLRILVAMVMLYRELGPSSMTAVAVLMALVPLNALLVAASNKALRNGLAHTDERTKLEAEMVSGIMVIKCSAWEEPLQERIEAARKRELAQLWRVTVYTSLVTFMLISVPVVIPLATFAVFLAVGNQLDASKAFTCMVLFNILRFPLFQLPMLVSQYSAARVSVGRLRDFLAADVAPQQPREPPAEPGATAVRLVGDFGWDSRRPPSLVDVNLDFKAGQLIAIVGSTGSGKSTLISAILGQTQQVCGPPPRVAGRLAYVPQSPFIVNATVRENVLFGQPYDPARYQAALEGACLMEDLRELPGGDLTELGDRGVNVSGGQKQRIALARALFHQPDVVLLDDPLSALDAAVGRRVFEQGIVRGLLSSGHCTVVLATNQLHFVRRADVVVVLEREGGRVAEVGPPGRLLAERPDGAFASLMRKEVQAEAEAETKAETEGDKKLESQTASAAAATAASEGTAAGAAATSAAGPMSAADHAMGNGAHKYACKDRPTGPEGRSDDLALALAPTTGLGSASVASAGGGGGGSGSAAAAGSGKGGSAAMAVAVVATAGGVRGHTGGQVDVARITQDERTAEGAVDSRTLGAYLGAMGVPGGAVAAGLWLMGGFTVAEVLRVATSVWLADWTESVNASGPESYPAPHGPMWYLGMYAAISGAQMVVQAASTLDCGRLGLAAAQKLHSRLLARLLGAPLSFFHSTPLGRIVNRLTKDTADIDRSLAQMAATAARVGLQLVSTLVLVGAVAPFALPALVVIMLAFYWLYQYFQAGVRQVKRLDAVARSPVMSSLTEALNGTATYLAYDAQGRASAHHAALLDSVSVMALVNQSMNRWLSVRLEVLGAAAALLAGVVAMEQRTTAGAAGLVMSYALLVTSTVSLTVRAASMAETMLNSVERVVEYCDIEQEGVQPPQPAGGRDNGGGDNAATARFAASAATAQASGGGGSSQTAPAPTGCPPGWPSAGVVEFREVQLRYRPGLPLVLHGVSFRTEAREKVGVVGRTGAGKSSLLGCLFRLVEVERGAVLIDGLNIARMPLRELRARLSLIPQSPVLFTGPIRVNLSPFGRRSDAELWGALRRAHLAGLVESWPAGLDTELAEGGAPLSSGQKQLLALARALLNPAKVLVLDEATANVDIETDALIQSTLRTEFPDRTLLAIAHRLATIIDYNKILLLEAGRVLEYDTPSALLGRPDSAFGRLVDETGEASARVLRQLAEEGARGLQHLLEAPARAALDRLASFSGPARQPSSSSGPLLSPAQSFLRRHTSFGLSRAGSVLAPATTAAIQQHHQQLLARGGRSLGGLMGPLEGGGERQGEGEAEGGWAAMTLPQLAAMVAGRSCAVAGLVKELREDMEERQRQQLLLRQQAAADGSVGASVDIVGMVMAAAPAAVSDEDGIVGASSGGDDDIISGGGGTRDAGLAKARLALARCLAFLEDARLGALALQRGWTAAGLEDGAAVTLGGGGASGEVQYGMGVGGFGGGGAQHGTPGAASAAADSA